MPDRPGLAARLFRALADRVVNVDMIVQNTSVHGTTDISFTVPGDDLAGRVEMSQAPGAELGATGRHQPTPTWPGSRWSAPG